MCKCEQILGREYTRDSCYLGGKLFSWFGERLPHTPLQIYSTTKLHILVVGFLKIQPYGIKAK